MEPVMTMSDAAEAPANAAKGVFSSITTRGMCYPHVHQAVDKKTKGLSPKLREQWFKDLNALAIASTPGCFDVVSKLFIAKYKDIPETSNLAEYFEKEWLNERLKNWYNGVLPGWSMHNANLEATNKWMKKYILEQQTPVSFGEFIENSMKWMELESMKRSESSGIPIVDLKLFHNKPILDGNHYEGAYQFSIQKTIAIRSITGHTASVYITVSEDTEGSKDFTQQSADAFFETFSSHTYGTFDEYKKFNQHVRVIRRAPDSMNDEKFVCNCHYHAKHFTCWHSYGLALRLRANIPLPEQYKNVDVGSNRKRGRPRLNPPAWIREQYSCIVPLPVEIIPVAAIPEGEEFL
jgi:hypothetical protein